MSALSAWLATAFVLALSAEQNCAVGTVDAQVLARTEVLPLSVTQKPTLPCEVRTLSDTTERFYLDVRDAKSALLLNAEGLSVERLNIRSLNSRVATSQRLALIGSGLDDQITAELCGHYRLNADVVVVKGGARAWRARVVQAGPDEEIAAIEALQSIQHGPTPLLQIAPSLHERKLFAALSPHVVAKLNPHLFAEFSEKPVLVLSNQPIAPLPRNWFLVRGGALALAQAIEFAHTTNRQSGALKRPCFYP